MYLSACQVWSIFSKRKIMFCIVELGAFDLIGKVFENRWIKEKG
jgi:hypothetical protein